MTEFGRIIGQELHGLRFLDFVHARAPFRAYGGQAMTELTGKRLLKLGASVAIVLTVMGFSVPMTARRGEETSLRVVVKDAASDEPIFQAQLTLRFQVPQKFRQPKWLSYSAKTNKKGEYVFKRVNKGPIVLMVTAEDHQSFGKKFKVDEDDSTIEVKLRRPQPQV